MKAAVCKAQEAAALQVLLQQGPASPPLPVGHFRPENEPCLKPSGGWAFSWATGFSVSRLKLTATTLRVLVPGMQSAPLGPPPCPALALPVRGSR